jgi:hypothetical protein
MAISTGVGAGDENKRSTTPAQPAIVFQAGVQIDDSLKYRHQTKMRIFSTAAVLVVSLGILTLTGCVEMQALDVRPKSGTLLIDSTDVLYVKGLLAQIAKDYDLEPQELVSSDMIASYQGGKKGPFSAGIVFILLWQHPSPSRLEIDISGPTPVGATILSKRIFSEVKAKLIEHFGSDRVRDVSKTVLL